MPPIPILVESDDQLPEGAAELYTKTDDGRYILDVEGVDNHPDVQGLKTSLEKQKKDREKLRQERDKLYQRAQLLPEELPEDVDSETIREAIERLQSNGQPNGHAEGEGEEGKDAAQKDAELYRQQLERRFQKQLEERDRQLQEKDEALKSLNQKLKDDIRDRALTEALSKHIKSPGRLKGAKMLLATSVQVNEGEDGILQPVVDTGMGEVSVDKYVTDWVSSDEGADFLDPSTGSGARGAYPGQGPKGPKELSREQFEQLDATQRKQFIKNGGRIA